MHWRIEDSRVGATLFSGGTTGRGQSSKLEKGSRQGKRLTDFQINSITKVIQIKRGREMSSDIRNSDVKVQSRRFQ